MAYVTIPQLPQGSDLSGLEQFEAVQSSTSVKLTANQLKAFITINPSFSVDDANNTGVTVVTTFTHTTTGIPAAGIGTAIDFKTETQPAVITLGSQISSISTDVTSSIEDFDLAFSVMSSGSLVEGFRLTSDKYLGIGTSTPTSAIHAAVDDASTSTIITVGTLSRGSSGGPSAGIGAGLAYEVDTNSGLVKGAQIAAVATSVSSLASSFDLAIQLVNIGSALTEVARFTSNKRLGIGTSTPGSSLEVVTEDTNVSAVVGVARFSHKANGTPLVGIGAAIDFSIETADNVNNIGAAIYAQSTDLSSGAEDFDLAFSVMQNGVAGVEVVRLTSDRRVGINTATPSTTIHAVANDTTLNAPTTVARLTHSVTGTAAIGIGTALDFETEVANGSLEIGGVISSEATNVSAGSESFDLVFKTMNLGATALERFRIGSTVISPSLPFDYIGAGVMPTVSTRLEVATNSLTISPLHFDTAAPTLLTTAQNGSFDFNGQALYFTPQNLERGVVATRQTYINSAGTRAGPNAANTAQTATFSAGSSTITVAAAPGAAIGNTGNLVVFAGTTAPTGITFGQAYWVNWLTATTINVSATQNGTPITVTTAGASVTATFYFSILGNGTTAVGLNLAANTRYMYELYFTISHTGAAGTTVAYALQAIAGTLSAHAYRVASYNSSAAITGDLTGVALTSQGAIANYITSNFGAFVTVTGATAAVANTTNLVQITGTIDTLTSITQLVPVIGMPVAPTLSTIYRGAYMSIYPVGPVVSNTAIGNWVS